MTANPTFIESLEDRLPEIPADSIVSRTIHGDEKIKVTLFGFAPGQEMTEHTAAHPAVLIFLNGEGTLQLGAEDHAVGPGCWVHMPADMPHSLRAKSQLVFALHLLK